MDEGRGQLLLVEVLLSELGHWMGVEWEYLQRMVEEEEGSHLFSVASLFLEEGAPVLVAGKMAYSSQVP